MQIVVLSNDELKDELLSNKIPSSDIHWISEAEVFFDYKEADAFIDLLFDNDKERIKLLKELLPKPVIINSVTETLAETDASFIRINGWNSFLQSDIIEGSATNNETKKIAEDAFQKFGKTIEWVPDIPGFITPRVISMIINEAFFALAEGVSTTDEIDTAMKLGTAYPYGPFEWSKKIGLQNIATLLQKLSVQQPRYTPSELLVQETNKAI